MRKFLYAHFKTISKKGLSLTALLCTCLLVVVTFSAANADGTFSNPQYVISVPAAGVNPNAVPISTTATISSATSVSLALNGQSIVIVQGVGALTGGFVLEASADGGVTWQGIIGINPSATTTTGAGGTWNASPFLYTTNVGGFTNVRVRCTVYTSGSTTITLQAGSGSLLLVNGPGDVPLVNTLCAYNINSAPSLCANVVASALYATTGGAATATVPTGAANTVLKASAGRLVAVLVTTAGTGATDTICYDNATTNSGTIIGYIPKASTAGTIIKFDMPASAGITCANVLNGPVFTASYY